MHILTSFDHKMEGNSNMTKQGLKQDQNHVHNMFFMFIMFMKQKWAAKVSKGKL